MFALRLGKGKVSQLAKKSLFELFKQLCQKMGRTDMNFSTYAEAKNAAADFQRAKHEMITTFWSSGFGPWVKKPVEEKMFS